MKKGPTLEIKSKLSSNEVLLELTNMEPTKVEHMLLNRAEEIKPTFSTKAHWSGPYYQEGIYG